MAYEIIELAVSAITAAGVIFAGATYFSDRKRQRQIATIEEYKKLQKNALTPLNKWKPSEIKAICDDTQSDAYKELGVYLAETELFCVAVNKRIYDFDTFYQIAHGSFDSERGTIMPRLLPLIEKKNRNPKEDYFANIHKIWTRMERKEK